MGSAPLHGPSSTYDGIVNTIQGVKRPIKALQRFVHLLQTQQAPVLEEAEDKVHQIADCCGQDGQDDGQDGGPVDVFGTPQESLGRGGGGEPERGVRWQ